jgi:hypothetical protein
MRWEGLRNEEGVRDAEGSDGVGEDKREEIRKADADVVDVDGLLFD